MSTYAENRAFQTSRDQRILRYLAGGPSVISKVIEMCFDDKHHRMPSIRTCRERLNKLSRRGFIEIKRYVELSRDVTVVALTEQGRSVLSTNMDKDSIRVGLCSQKTLRHELILSDIARKILAEVDDGKYSISFMQDDKAVLQNRKKKKGEYYPDLFLELLRQGLSPFRINMELDAGAKGSVYWRGKLTSWEHTSLVLVPEASRIKKLVAMLAGSNHATTIGFSTVEVFLRLGLAETSWWFLPDGQYGKIQVK